VLSGVTVHILTTTGPATIQRIREEDSNVASVICLDGRAEALPVSPAYDAFVRKPIGIVEKLTGHDAYRMDISARVDEGRSWQLAAYIAHVALLKATAPDLHIFATGEVDDALSVRAVAHIAEKLQALSIFLETNDIPRDQAVIFIPAANENILLNHDGITVHAVTAVSDALQVIGPDDVIQPSEKLSRNNEIQTSGRGVGWAKWAVLLSIIGLLFWFGANFARWQALSDQGRAFELEEAINNPSNVVASLRSSVFRKWLSFRKPVDDYLKFDGTISIAANVGACMTPEVVSRGPITETFKSHATVCEIEMSAYVADPSLKVVGRMAYWPTGLGASERAMRTMRGHNKPTGRTWNLAFMEVPEPGAVVRLITITGRSVIQGPQPWFQDLLRATLESPAFTAARQRIEMLGYSVAVKDWHRK